MPFPRAAFRLAVGSTVFAEGCPRNRSPPHQNEASVLGCQMVSRESQLEPVEGVDHDIGRTVSTSLAKTVVRPSGQKQMGVKRIRRP